MSEFYKLLFNLKLYIDRYIVKYSKYKYYDFDLSSLYYIFYIITNIILYYVFHNKYTKNIYKNTT